MSIIGNFVLLPQSKAMAMLQTAKIAPGKNSYVYMNYDDLKSILLRAAAILNLTTFYRGTPLPGSAICDSARYY